MKKNILMLLILAVLPALMLQAQTCLIQGDADESGVVNIVDALLVAQDYVGTVSGNYNPACADANCNGAVDIVDALLIAQFYVGLIQSFPCEATPKPNNTPVAGEYVISIAAGSTTAIGDFEAEQYFTGGETYTNTATIDVSGLSKPAPAALFNNERYGDMTYTIPGFTASAAYTVNLYFAETYLTSSGGRVFNVSINGNLVLPDFDIYAAAGAQNKAVVMSFTTNASASGQIIVQFTSVTENPKINGISVQAGSIPTEAPTVAPTPDPNSNGSSEGCGKALSDLKSGTYNITSAGLSRRYIIRIPDNYDKDKPYRLIFGMHCMGSSDQGVVDSQYYGLLPYSQSSNTPVIFVAPQGYTDGSPWRVSDNKDHTFFADMLKLFKEKLCVDTKRVFTCGFSYGAMVSYSLSMAFQDDVRAFATYAPANWNIWLPQRNNKPVAYYQTTGTGDTLCSWVNNDGNKTGGKYCVIQHLEDNDCTVPANIPLANSGTHVLTKFNCNTEYPVWFSSHNGGHTDNVRDPGSNVNWVAKETWDFFMQF
ncbi:MAG: hypothetical protein JXR70_02675 [Spirochaetales bacterium]|nr:hypothetical protein [Spirochaetales bacterium]